MLQILVHAGFGQHIDYVHPAHLPAIIKFITLFESMTVPSLTCSRVSICIFILKVLKGTNGFRKKCFLYITIVLLLMVGCLSVGFTLGQCQPITKIWNPTLPGTCQFVNALQKDSYLQGGTSPNSHRMYLC